MIRAALIACLASVALAGIPWEGEPRPEQGWMDKHNSFVQNTINNGANISV